VNDTRGSYPATEKHRKTNGDVVKKAAVMMLMLFAAGPAHSQVRRRMPSLVEPSTWISGGIGLFNGNGVNDGSTNSSWDFGNATTPQYRLAIEQVVGRSTSIGAATTYTHVPFTYLGSEGCGECAAHLDMVTLGATIRYGAGPGLHQVLEGTAGVVDYMNLKRDVDKTKLPPTGGNVDPYFVFGYGFGYTFNPQMEISIVQDFGLGLHERDGLTSEDSNTLRQRTLRLNFRYGTGNRATRKNRPAH
jgi:hypothetical protein